MFGSYFSPLHQGVLFCAAVCVAFEVWQAWQGKTKTSVALLAAAAFILRGFAATLDPFLNQWDECFHALVAKRMLDDPVTPRLFLEGVLPTSTSWAHAGIWLHKPPFFLWQIAASLAVFGPEPWAVRIPSVLWLTALVPVSYRMGQLLADDRAAWVAALLTTCSYYLLELTAGAFNTDHNDTIFIATVACSWWALLELWNDGRRRWALLAGLFAACAILTKLFVGAAVFLPWLAVVMWKRDRRAWAMFGFSAAVAVVLCGLWFGSLAVRFPEELQNQWAFKLDHIARAVDDHRGTWTFHFDVIQKLMGPLVWWLVVPAYGLMVWRSGRMEHRVFLLVLFVAIHATFAWADTKMVSYTMVLFPLYTVAVGAALVVLVDSLIIERFRRPLTIGVAALLAGHFLNIEAIQHWHTLASPPKEHQQWRQQQLDALPVMDELASFVKDPERSVVYHVPALHHIQFMFAHGIEATDGMPLAADVERLRNVGYVVYAVQDGEPLERFPPGVVVVADTELRFPDVGRPN